MNWTGWGIPQGILWMCLTIRNNNIWFRGGDLKGFCDKRSFIKRRGWGMPPPPPPGDPQSVPLDGSYLKEQEYVWLRDGALNGF